MCDVCRLDQRLDAFFLLVSLQVLSALDILQPPQIDCFEEMYPLVM